MSHRIRWQVYSGRRFAVLGTRTQKWARRAVDGALSSVCSVVAAVFGRKAVAFTTCFLAGLLSDAGRGALRPITCTSLITCNRLVRDHTRWFLAEGDVYLAYLGGV